MVPICEMGQQAGGGRGMRVKSGMGSKVIAAPPPPLISPRSATGQAAASVGVLVALRPQQEKAFLGPWLRAEAVLASVTEGAISIYRHRIKSDLVSSAPG